MRTIAAFAVIATASFAALGQASSLPVFPAKNVPETFFGTRVDDPYRALILWQAGHADFK